MNTVYEIFHSDTGPLRGAKQNPRGTDLFRGAYFENPCIASVHGVEHVTPDGVSKSRVLRHFISYDDVTSAIQKYRKCFQY